MTTTPYDIIGKEALYDMIDYFYTLVEKDERLNHLFPGDFAETSRKQKQFLTQFWAVQTFIPKNTDILC